MKRLTSCEWRFGKYLTDERPTRTQTTTYLLCWAQRCHNTTDVATALWHDWMAENLEPQICLKLAFIQYISVGEYMHNHKSCHFSFVHTHIYIVHIHAIWLLQVPCNSCKIDYFFNFTTTKFICMYVCRHNRIVFARNTFKYIYISTYARVCVSMFVCVAYIYLLSLSHLSPTSLNVYANIIHQRRQHTVDQRHWLANCQLATTECRNRVATDSQRSA